MIRINLLPAKEAKKAQAPGQTFAAVAMFFIFAELGGLYMWYSSKDEELGAASAAAAAAKRKIAEFTKQETKLKKAEAKRQELSNQNAVFHRLKAEKNGPVEMLQYISYVLTVRERNDAHRDEIFDQEHVGWKTHWNPTNLWLTELKEEYYEITIKGQAKENDDVAEFLYRLDSGIYFVSPTLVKTQRKIDLDWKEIDLVNFEVTAGFNHDQDGTPKFVREDVPYVFEPFMPPPTPKGKKGKANAKKGKGA